MAGETHHQLRKRQKVADDGYETLAVQEQEESLITLETTAAAKRHKSYHHIISLLADEDDQKFDPQTESTSDLSSLMTSLQQELSTAAAAAPDAVSDEEEKERVFRHLLEASDDELGLPTKTEEEEVVSGENICYSGESFVMDGFNDFGEGNLWEIEDEAANYYAMLQSDLFM